MAMTYEYQTRYGDYVIHFVRTAYADNGNLALMMVIDDGEDCIPGEMYGVPTVNLGVPCDEDCAFIDTNNMPDVLDFIIDNGLGDLTGRNAPSGFCMYPEVRFYPEFLADCDVQ